MSNYDSASYLPLEEEYTCWEKVCVYRTCMERKLIVSVIIMAITIIGLIVGMGVIHSEYLDVKANTTNNAILLPTSTSQPSRAETTTLTIATKEPKPISSSILADSTSFEETSESTTIPSLPIISNVMVSSAKPRHNFRILHPDNYLIK